MVRGVPSGRQPLRAAFAIGIVTDMIAGTPIVIPAPRGSRRRELVAGISGDIGWGSLRQQSSVPQLVEREADVVLVQARIADEPVDRA